MKSIITLSTLILMLALASPVLAGLTIGDSVYVDFLGVSNDRSVQIRVGTHDIWTKAGSYNIRVDGELYHTFCIDIWQNANDGTFTVTALENAPKTGGAGYVLGTKGAADIIKLLSYNYDDLGTDRDKWAGLQVAVWEVVGDHNKASYDLASGTFQLKYASTSVRDYAKQYLLSITEGSGDLTNYAAVTNNCKQDYVVPLVPAPAAIMLGTLGIGLVRWMRRHRTL